ncbi:di/tricarboxylate transporter [Rhizobium skierniewicense]|uniref:Di/tricarboxylate transporter n=1 Tax=Rhizobium skierniewicense TaxID=984260 RepID=A0A7W6CGB2_9HYPH|nr:SLC13 family permease [Rhizobium skierniewicense]MBB3948135.1 di/tricarboxylate transporter [Rhizobium skierniewicense]
MSSEVITILGLAVMFIVATALPINMGALGFALSFIIGTLVVGMSVKQIFEGFPGDLFVTLVGITYLFAIAQNNGTVDWLVQACVRAVRGRISAIPWVMFFVSALLTAIGAVSPAAVAIIAPIALRFSAKYGINPLLMGIMVIHGAQGGGFSPISIYGGITNQVVARAGLPGDETVLFLASLGFNLLIAVCAFFVLGRKSKAAAGSLGSGNVFMPGVSVDVRGSGGHMAVDPRQRETELTEVTTTGKLDLEQALTLAGLAALATLSLVFSLNVGLVAMCVAVVLALVCPRGQKGAVDKIAWSTVLLIAGVITYIGVLEKSGAIAFVGNGVSSLAMPLLAALLLCYIGGIVSAFASSVGVMGAMIPLAVPMLMQGDLSTPGMIAALAISATIVDVSPFSTNGALVVANAQNIDQTAFFRILLFYSTLVVALGPLLAWLVFVAPGWI